MRILFVSHATPYPPITGGAQRTNLLLRALGELGDVDCIFLLQTMIREPDVSILRATYSVRMLSRMGNLIERSPYAYLARILGKKVAMPVASFLDADRIRLQPNKAMMREFYENIDLDSYELIVGRYLQGVSNLGIIEKRPVLVDIDDYHVERTRLRVNDSNWWKRLTLNRSLQFTQDMLPKRIQECGHCWISNPADRKHTGLENATLLPNIPFHSAQGESLEPLPMTSGCPVLLTVATCDYNPNVGGINWFLRQVWPTIHQKYPKAEYWIAGSGMNSRLQTRWSRIPGVRALGFVSELEDVYERCWFGVAPLRTGAGTSIKVLEACAYGRTSVVTRIAYRGLSETLPEEEAVWVADDESTMIEACLRLLSDRDAAMQSGPRALDSFTKNYSFDKFRRQVRQGVDIALRQ